MPVIGRQVGLRRRQAGNQTLHRQMFEDHTGRERQHFIGFAVQHLRHGGAGVTRGAHALLAGGGVGDAGVDHQRTNAATARQMLATQGNRRRTAAILSEHSRSAAPRCELDQRQVAPVLLADARLCRAETNAGDGKQGFRGGGGVIDGHESLLEYDQGSKTARHNPRTASTCCCTDSGATRGRAPLRRSACCMRR
jgi:hypothetical protein